ncbi:hypothetical protein MNBD_GAMMA13-1686 [hydrothermal vent metagenome]|uniref:Amidohydrolase-related domain-containing protein n=1 Tax=hydrothermal vent metagenome TaxID=652676 RepID=A0A3B0Y6B9_9ZZZZ
MTKTLIRNGYIVTVNRQRDIFPAGYVIIEGTNIVEVGPADKCPDADGFDTVVEARNSVVMPGLINAHQHDWYGLFKGIADGLLLEDWVDEILLPLANTIDVEAHRLGSLSSGIEMLATGTTCSLNHSVTTTTPEVVSATIQAQLDIGIRQVYAKDMRCRTPGHPNHPYDLAESIAEFEQEYDRWNQAENGMVNFAMALETNAHWVAAGMSTDALVRGGYDLAGKLGIQITGHISGGTFSLEKGFLKYLRETGRTDVRYLMQLGVLDSSWILAHGIHITELDIEHMAKMGASLVYTPSSESVRGGGIGPASNALKAGVNVALGTDGPMVDYTVDMLEQVKDCVMMQHVRHLNPTRVPPETAIEMATINAAKALNLDDKIGSLEVGKCADIAIFDLERLHVGVVHRPISSLVFSGRGSDVSTVLVNGEIVFQNGRVTRDVDTVEIFTAAEKVARTALQQTGLVKKLSPHWRVPVPASA